MKKRSLPKKEYFFPKAPFQLNSAFNHCPLLWVHFSQIYMISFSQKKNRLYGELHFWSIQNDLFQSTRKNRLYGGKKDFDLFIVCLLFLKDGSTNLDWFLFAGKLSAKWPMFNEDIMPRMDLSKAISYGM